MSEYISIKTLAGFHNINESVLLEMLEYEIVPVKKSHNEILIDAENLNQLERALRLYAELGVNMQGIDIICRMRTQLEALQEEVLLLRKLVDNH